MLHDSSFMLYEHLTTVRCAGFFLFITRNWTQKTKFFENAIVFSEIPPLQREARNRKSDISSRLYISGSIKKWFVCKVSFSSFATKNRLHRAGPLRQKSVVGQPLCDLRFLVKIILYLYILSKTKNVSRGGNAYS